MNAEEVKNRVINVANYMIATKKTVREIAKKYGVCKSTIHLDLVKRLPKYSFDLSMQVNEIIATHKEERHVKGGEVTKIKYSKTNKLFNLIKRYKVLREWFSVGEVISIADRTYERYMDEIKLTKDAFLETLSKELLRKD